MLRLDTILVFEGGQHATRTWQSLRRGLGSTWKHTVSVSPHFISSKQSYRAHSTVGTYVLTPPITYVFIGSETGNRTRRFTREPLFVEASWSLAPLTQA